jgi:ferritin-like metal-binding protein YciE
VAIEPPNDLFPDNGSARTYANLLGEREAGWFLEQTLDEEKEADAKLTQLAEGINVAAEPGEEGEEVESELESASHSTRRRRPAA